MKRIANNNTDLLYELVKTSFKLKYNGSILGFIWVILKPFLQFLILYVVFSNVAGNQTIKAFPVYLIIGLVIFTYFQESIVGGLNSLKEKAHIILKVNFDRKLAVYSSIILALINLFVNFVVITIFMLFNPVTLRLEAILYALFIVFILFILNVGISFFTSVISIRIKDIQHLVEVGFQLLFYATPIIYKIDVLPEKYQQIAALNPIYIIIQSVRAALINGEIAFLKEIIVIAIISLVIFILGMTFFNNQVTKIAEKF